MKPILFFALLAAPSLYGQATNRQTYYIQPAQVTVVTTLTNRQDGKVTIHEGPIQAVKLFSGKAT